MNRKRAWCFFVHRWWTVMERTDPYYCEYRCARCGELWNRP